MRLELCDLCGRGSDAGFEDEITLRYVDNVRGSRQTIYRVCPDCAAIVERALVEHVAKGKVKRDKVVAVAVDRMEELF